MSSRDSCLRRVYGWSTGSIGSAAPLVRSRACAEKNSHALGGGGCRRCSFAASSRRGRLLHRQTRFPLRAVDSSGSTPARSALGPSRPSRRPNLMLGARGTRYRLGMAQEAEASSGHAIARLADSGEEAMRNLVALPLRMFAGALGIFEELFRTAADAVSDGDPRVVDLERRVDSLEEQVQTSRRSSAGRKT